MFESATTAVITATENDTSPVAALDDRFAQVAAQLRKELGDTAFRSWIAPLASVSLSGGVLEIAAPTRFVRDWVAARYADRIRALWQQNFGAAPRVDISVSARKTGAARPISAEDALVPVANENADAPAGEDISSPLDARFTFETYITGKSNELAYAAARKVADSADVPFNPLFLQGGVGLGKTHLMHAIAHSIRTQNPQRKVVYMSAEKFMYRFVRALRFKDTMAFKEQFRTVDVLMIDDIQFICGKESTQEEFFHTFNALIDQGKQIVVSADKSPSDLDGIEERLRSRLGMGLVADIHPTTYELRLGILQSKCALMKRELPQDVLEFLADKIAANVRELEGALNRLIAHAELVNRPVTVESAQDLLQDLLRANDRRVTVEDIQKKVAAHYNIRVADMHSPRRARPVARPRQVAMYLAKALTQHSLPEIGRKFGGRDHTTIIHGVRRIESLMETDRGIREDIDILTRAISG
ncbi:MAG: chromosomal replication initiator protein DnaA [Alphaproteobacteria bacterium]|nr:chromosomal replication initiator protein DnaA [Alphaproteobacteria bacterium]